MSKTLEQAQLLLRKSASDERVLDVQPGEISDDIFGFHAQQAVEKLLKALLSARQVTFRHTHDLATLLDQIADAGAPLPTQFDALKTLTVYAVAFRYADLPPEVSVDRPATRELVRQLREFAKSEISHHPS